MWPLQFALCSVGAVLINKPFAPDPTCPATTAGLPLAAALSGALMNLASRGVKEVPPPIVNMYNDFVAVAYAIGSTAILARDASILPSIVPDRMDRSLGLLVLAGIIGWAGLLCNVRGYQSVSVAAVASIAAYVSVPLGYIIQVVVFDEVFDKWSAAGATIIVCTNVTSIVAKYVAAEREKKVLHYKPLPDGETPEV